MITGDHSTTGHPLFVGGPQIGYFYPGLTSRSTCTPGAAVARRDLGAVPRLPADRPRRGLRLDADLGRRRHHRPVRRDALRRQRHEVPVQGQVPRDGHVRRRHARRRAGRRSSTTVHGPVVGYATVNGKKVAISSQALELRQGRRSTCSSTAGSRTARCTAPKSFFKAAALTPQTFNSFYIDDKHIAMYTAGLLPIRAKDVDPGLPTQRHRQVRVDGLPRQGAATRRAIDPEDGHDHQLEPDHRARASARPTTSGAATARPSASTCSTRTSTGSQPRTASGRWRR